MVELQANPDMETLKIWIGAMIALLVLLITIVGWFLSRRDDAVTAAISNLNKVVDASVKEKFFITADGDIILQCEVDDCDVK